MGAETSEAPGYEKQLDGEQQAHTRVDDSKAVKQAYGLLVYGSSRRRLAQVDGNGRRNYSTVWSVYSVCSVLSLTGYGVRNAGLVLLAVVCNAVVLMLVVCAASATRHSFCRLSAG